MKKNNFLNIIEGLNSIEQDEDIPRNVKIKIKSAIDALSDEKKTISLRVDRSIEELNYVAEDPCLPNETRMQILTLMSLLESRE